VLTIFKQTGIPIREQKRQDTVQLIFSLLIALVLFFSLLFGLMALKEPQGFVLDGTWLFQSADGETSEITLPFFEAVAEEGAYTYTKHFGPVEADTLIIPQISAYGYAITLNGIRIATINDPENKTANIWNQTQHITFDPQLLQEDNTLEITLYGLFDHGINYLPYLTMQNEVMLKVSLNRYLENDIYLISIGAAISFGFVLFALGLAIPEKKAFHYSFALTAILIGIYLFDYPFRIYTCERTLYLLFRKILFSSLYLSGFFLLQGIEYYLYGKRRFSKLFI